jgi:hypothetical protein
MQVNSAQDYLTNRKRQIIAATYNTQPPPQKRRSNAVFLSAVANGATRYQRFVAPVQAPAGLSNTNAPGTAAFNSLCCLTPTTQVLGSFTTTTDPGVVRVQDLNVPMSYRAT